MYSYQFATTRQMLLGLLREIRDKGTRTYFNHSLGANELLYVHSAVTNPLERCEFQSLSTMFFDLIETVFVLSGRTDSYLLPHYKSVMALYEEDGHFPGAVGPRWYEIYGDQLEHCYRVLQKDAESRQAIMCLMDPGHMPCSTYCQFLIRNGQLDLYLNFRASDLMNYGYSDTFTYTTLQELMAFWLDVEVGTFHYVATSLHLSDPDLEKAELLLQRGAHTDQAAVRIPLRLQYEGFRNTFSDMIDLISEWHRSELKEVKYHLQQIEEQSWPQWIVHWLKLFLSERYYRVDREGEARLVLNEMEPSDLKTAMLYFLDHPADSILEVV